MSAIFIITLAIQVGLIIHCVRTGRNTIWIWVLALLSLPGAIAYVAVEILPGLFGSRTARRAARGVRRTLDPGQNLRRYESEARHNGNVANRQRYADELVAQGQAREAIEVYRQTLTGLYEHDPNLMLGMARAQFAAGDGAAARATLDALIATNPDFKSQHGHLLYARALEAEGNAARALEEYQVLAGYYAGAEARFRYAMLLKAQDQSGQARQVLIELLEHARHAPRHYRKAQAEWLSAAERELGPG